MTLVVPMMVLLCSCEKDDIMPTKDIAFGKLEIVLGDNQTGYFGEFLSEFIEIRASSINNHRKYLIKWEMIQGNGSIEPVYYNYGNVNNVDSTGLLELKWRLGCDNVIQKIKLFLYVDSTITEYGNLKYYSTPSDTLTITANGIKPTGWAKSCGCENVDTYSSKITSYDNNTLYLVNRGLFYSTDQGLNWYKVDGVPEWGTIVDAQFNSYGWLYILTKDNGICYSKDLKKWDYINNGILDPRYPEAFLVEDSTLFVSFLFDGLYKTSNNGEFWRKLLVGGGGEYYQISRHPNGDLYVFDKWSDLYLSKNFGYTWGKVNVEYKYVNSPVYDLEIDKNGFIYIGADDATISKLFSDTHTGEIHKYYEMNHSSQQVEDIKIINNIAYFTVNGNPTPGIYSSQNWQRLDLGFTGRISNYYLKNDGTFLLISSDGVYYYNE